MLADILENPSHIKRFKMESIGDGLPYRIVKANEGYLQNQQGKSKRKAFLGGSILNEIFGRH